MIIRVPTGKSRKTLNRRTLLALGLPPDDAFLLTHPSHFRLLLMNRFSESPALQCQSMVDDSFALKFGTNVNSHVPVPAKQEVSGANAEETKWSTPMESSFASRFVASIRRMMIVKFDVRISHFVQVVHNMKMRLWDTQTSNSQSRLGVSNQKIPLKSLLAVGTQTSNDTPATSVQTDFQQTSSQAAQTEPNVLKEIAVQTRGPTKSKNHRMCQASCDGQKMNRIKISSETFGPIVAKNQETRSQFAATNLEHPMESSCEEPYTINDKLSEDPKAFFRHFGFDT
eukprot:Gregarina_sp_Poly_1__352@NODE_1085_length_5145_cov_250_530327_g753_i0_p3_GENE_NODE_1085_length_5145_cov_250_530327_g753_i0NODE_1085_length_5145_cov_250_530327_g753_i0_p3_ORF_typecomplete_len284_score34_59_NODE_1085_length_5145_cov_250_530327_g753_i026943545